MVTCPVEWCDYENSPASVAGHISGTHDDDHDWQKLGYEGIWDFRNQFETESAACTTILHMTDSHIGKISGGFFKTKWEVDCAKGFQMAIDKAIELDVDSVLHTGDLFHNDQFGISESQKYLVENQLWRLNRYEIPFLYIVGDHERENGQAILHWLANIGYAKHLTQIPVNVGEHVALYGQDHRNREFWNCANWKPEPPGDRFSILGLHQSMAPYSPKKPPDLHVKDIKTWTAKNSGFSFNVIALGQLHREIDEMSEATRVICGGATERLGKTESAIEPSVGLFQVTSDDIKYRRIYL